MLMFVARKLEAGIDIIGCRGGGGGYLVIACSEPSSGYLEVGVDVDIEVPEVIDDDGGCLVALTWVILSLSPWLLANSLMVSMMDTVCTWALPPFMIWTWA